MQQLTQKLVWLATLIGVFAIGTGAMRALHVHVDARGGDSTTAAKATHSLSHTCDGDHDHSHVAEPGQAPSGGDNPDPCHGGSEQDCATCQLINAFSKVNVSPAVTIVIEIETQPTVPVACANESVIVHTHFDPHIPRGPPRA